MSTVNRRSKSTAISLILSVALVSGSTYPHPASAQEQPVAYAEPVSPELTKDEIISLIEDQYQLILDLPYTPTTEASLSALDMAMANITSASYEELQVFQEARSSTRALMTNVKRVTEMVQSDSTLVDASYRRLVQSSSASFDCPGFITVEGEAELPPGYCNQSDTQVVDIDYLPAGSNGELVLSDNQYPNDRLLCRQYTSPEVTAGLKFSAYLAKLVKSQADRVCKLSIHAFFAGGNCELCCIPTDLIELGFRYAAKGVEFCNSIRGASEGRTTYVRTGELFVQSSENTEYIDSALIDGFGTLNGELNDIQDQACQNTVRLNLAIAQLDETLRSLRIDNARLLDLFGDQLDPINPVTIPSPDCVLEAVSGTVPTNSSSEPPPTTITPPPTVQPPPDNEAVRLSNRRLRAIQR